MPAGRPTDYSEEFCDRVIELGAQGCSIAEMAADLGCVRQTINNWKKEHPEFLAAFQRALQLSEAWWEKEGRTSLHDPTIQTGLWYANMKNRFGWSDKQDTKLSGEVGFTEVRRTVVDPKAK